MIRSVHHVTGAALVHESERQMKQQYEKVSLKGELCTHPHLVEILVTKGPPLPIVVSRSVSNVVVTFLPFRVP
jgi:hypothetical protein